jgi:hypothetical protein
MMEASVMERQTSGRQPAARRTRRSSCLRVPLRAAQARALRCLAKCHMLTIGQYSRLVGRSYRRAASDFQTLTAMGIVQYACIYDIANAPPDGMLSPTRLYVLSRAAVQRCMQDGYIAPDDLTFTPDWKGEPKSANDIFHRLGVVDCQIAMLRSIGEHRTREIVSMIPDFIMRGEGKRRARAVADHLANGQRIEPDCVAVLRNNQDRKETTLFIEYENRNRDLKRFAEKLAAYRQYFAQGTRRHNRGSPTLLFVVKDGYRIATLTGAEDAWQNAPALRGAVRFACIDQLHDDFFGGAWVDGFGKPLPIIREGADA